LALAWFTFATDACKTAVGFSERTCAGPRRETSPSIEQEKNGVPTRPGAGLAATASITPAGLGVCQLAVGSELGAMFLDWECGW
jgi:hypothetical protein